MLWRTLTSFKTASNIIQMREGVRAYYIEMLDADIMPIRVETKLIAT